MMKKLYAMAAAGVLSLGLAACGSADGSATGQDGLTRVNVGNIKIAAQTDAYAADKLGYFEKHGLDVDFTYAESGQDILTAVSSGSLDLGLAIPGNAIVANANGLDYVGVVQDQVAHEKGPDTGGLIVRAESGITSLEDLEGHSVAVNATGANQVYVSVAKVLKDAGVDVDEVDFQEIPFPQMGSVLTQGQVDAIAAVDPFTTVLLSDSANQELAWFYVDALPGMPLGTYWATEKWVDDNTSVADAFRKAMTETIGYLNDHPDKARDLIAEFTGLDRKMLDTMPDIQWATNVSTENWERLIDMYVDSGLIDPTAVDEILTEGALQQTAG